MTQLNKRALDGALHISCTMNCLEVGAIGGGTMLSPQSKCLEVFIFLIFYKNLLKLDSWLSTRHFKAW